MYDTILIPTDGSDSAETATRQAMSLGEVFGSEIHLLSVIDDTSYSSALADLDPLVEDQEAGFERQATEALDRLETLLEKGSLSSQTAIERGPPRERIRSYAAEHDIDLIAMGTHGRTGLDRWLLGSVTERVVRTSDVPVLTTRPDIAGNTPYEHILIPTDGSEHARAAATHAMAIADRYDATVHALSVVDINAVSGAYDAGPAIPDLLGSLEAGCERAVNSVADMGEDHGVEVLPKVQRGTPYRVINEYVDDRGIDFLTMGTHGRAGLERYLVGSVTERTLRTSDVPVLTVRG